MTPTTVTDYLDTHSNHNDPNTNDPNSIDPNSIDPNSIDPSSNDPSSNDPSSNDPSSNNSSINNAEPLPPLLALGYVFMEQKCSLFGLQYKEDPTVILLYRIAKEALDHHLQDHQSTVDSLVDVTKETQKQFKRILEATNENEPNLKRVRNLASAGVLYTETCLHKYRRQYNTDSDEMPTPSDLPPSVEPPKERNHIDILQTIPPEPLDDIKYAREFKIE
ncbi:hypothetical protein PS15m_001131 [Mucor circinelloides]